MQIEERRTLEEAYADACTATNLRSEADKRQTAFTFSFNGTGGNARTTKELHESKH